MEEKELKEQIKKIVIVVVAAILFTTALTFVFINKFGAKEISVNKLIDKNKELYVLVINKKTKNVKEIEEVLKEKELTYTVVNKDQELHYNDFLKKLSITDEDIIEPTIIYVLDKKANSILVNIKKTDDLNNFLEYNMNS